MPATEKDFHSFMQFDPDSLPGIIVPQEVYVLPSPNNTPPLDPVRFTVDGQLGIRLRDALDHAFTALDDAATPPVMSQTATRVAIRILWPGYDSWYINMPVYDNTAATNPMNRITIARRVATNIHEFYNNMRNVRPQTNDRATSQWCLGNIPFDQLYLVELRHVSQGSWQPVLCFRANN